MISHANSISIARHLFLAAAFLGSTCFGAEDVIPLDRVIPDAKVFGADARLERSLVDESVLAWWENGTLPGKEFPHSGTVTYENPNFDFALSYWDSAESARKAFTEGYQKASSRDLVQVTTKMSKGENGAEFYEFTALGVKPQRPVLYKNVIFIVVDLFDEIGIEGVRSRSDAYLKYLREIAPAERPALPTPARKWTSGDGRSVQGKVIAIDWQTGKLTILREDGSKFPGFPIEQLSEVDQAFLDQYKPR